MFRVSLVLAVVMSLTLGGQARASDWIVGGTPLAKLAKSETVEGSGSMLFKVGGLLFNCETETEGSLLAGGTGELAVTFNGCQSGEEICVLEPFTATMNLSLSGVFVQIAPASGTTFANITFAETEEELCATPPVKTWPLNGTTAAETDEPGLESVVYPLKFSSSINSVNKTNMTFLLTQGVAFEGDLDLSLAGAHKKSPWGVEATPTAKLCKSNGESCEPYKLGTEMSAELQEGATEGVKFVFSYEGEKREPSCLVSNLSATSIHQGMPQLAKITALGFSECGGGLCSLSASVSVNAEIEATGKGDGTFSWAPSFGIKCTGMTETCFYHAEKAIPFVLAGGAPATFSHAGVALEGGGKKCGTTGVKWEGVAAAKGILKYKVKSPSPLFVRVL